MNDSKIGQSYIGYRKDFLHPYSSQTYRHVPIAQYSSLNVAPDDGTNDSPKHVEPINEKIMINHKNLCISLVYIHITGYLFQNKAKRVT